MLKKLLQAYQAGVNLGGWLSQNHDRSRKHYEEYITEKDIARIASWGMDHVRLPVDYSLFERDETPGIYDETGLSYIDRCLIWCERHGLNVLLDLHKAPGFDFSALDRNRLLSEDGLQERFLNLWRMFAKRYAGIGHGLAFELLNEMVDENSERWNRLAHRAIAAIREIDAERIVIFGGNRYNSIFTLAEIDVLPDPCVAYTFHFYEPILFTHYRAPWVPVVSDWPVQLVYPGEFAGLREVLDGMAAGRIPTDTLDNVYFEKYLGRRLDRELLAGDLQPAADFQDRTGKELYCGEYGVNTYVDPASRLNWHRDFIAVMRDLGIGRACWTYKEMCFGLVRPDGKPVDEELVKVISRR